MSRYLSSRFASLKEYVPGEQPKGQTFIKLNTNESPYPPSEEVIRTLENGQAEKLKLYSDPDCTGVRGALAGLYRVKPENVLVVNGSDEALNFAFMAYTDRGAIFPDISYGFYKVFAQLYGIDAKIMPLNADFTIRVEDYLMGDGALIVIANPNAPTGILLPLAEIERILSANPDSVVVVDEAYIDFGGVSALPLLEKYDNLLVVQTFSKSRSMAGARLGYAIGHAELIADLNRLRCSTNPYNVNRLTLAAGEAAIASQEYYDANAQRIIETRARTAEALSEMGFVMTDSKANFLFAKAPGLSGETVYRELRARGILVRHFDAPRIRDYNRITVGAPEEMDALITALRDILATVKE